MKLYFSPGACSLSPHIVLREASLSFDLVQVNLRDKTLADGSDYRAINPKGSVPLLVMADGNRLSEGPAIVQYLADQAPNSQLAPAAGTLEHYRLLEWLNFISSELHKGFSPLFNPATPEQAKQISKDNLQRAFTQVEAHLSQHEYLVGNTFSVADAYLFTVTGWAALVGVDISSFAALQAYIGRIAARPAVQAALRAEGLI